MHRKSMISLFLSLIVGLTTIGSVAAQEPQPTALVKAAALADSAGTPVGTAITYQGQLKHSGNPANGNFDFQFVLYDAASAGSQQGATLQISNVAVSNGLFNVQLDFGQGIFNGDTRFLEMGVKPAGSTETYTMLSPRTELSAVPYALGMPGMMVQNGNVGIGTALPQSRLTVNSLNAGSGVQDWIAGNFGGTTGDRVVMGLLYGKATIGAHNGTLNAWSDLILNTEGGNVGIGTTDPQAKLHVAGDLVVQAGTKKLVLSSGAAVDIVAPTNSLFIASRATGACPWECNNVLINPWVENGKVGIGTIDPQAKLHVAGDFIVEAGTKKIVLSSGAAVDIVAPTNSLFIASRGTGACPWECNNVLINPWGENGNVGIGTANPQAKLDIVGTTRSSVLQITGGSDLAELFSQADGALVEPGTVMVIDPEHPGKLMMSTSAYDRKVAGIISGAGGVNPGLTLQQEGVLDGNLHVAIAGRVYVKAEAQSGAIEPGDLLTTSDMAGYAMKATNDALSHGAIIGKAMTGLQDGTGLVLVLVNLQ